ncbi:hypothetical protein P3X46_016619 [Hevea brasiliensis]|uniref:Phytocyanin domain-containing protein n=1 Tax=Hevea brasiliensis TaxID=3981 RepID=A0ABQ9M3L7_HEVBR|nr:blue copper protein 1a [Hevea brasiliensis]KAJ9173496.1 hypothetical protein P3X46_016619 [Hevea brasiliensis]
MASSKICIIIAIAAVFVPSILATEFVVGDETGWTTNFDYQAWAQGKEFHVGDKLVFRYSPGAHNVIRVNGTGFQQCKAPDGAEALTTGEDTIPLTYPGKKWYICGVSNHCESKNMKLTITVLSELGSPATSPSPNQTPVPASTGNIALLGCCGWIIVAIAGILGMVMV